MILSFSIFTFGPDENKEMIRQGLEEQMKLTTGQAGHIRSFIATGIDNQHKYLLYSEWGKKEDYEAAGEVIRKTDSIQSNSEAFFESMIEEPVFGSFEVK